MPYKDELHEYGKLVLKTVATQAMLFVGDLDEGMKILRREVGRRLRELPRSERNAVVATLNASGRRVEKWITMANEADAEEVNEETSFRENSRAGRIFLTAMSYLKEGGDEYRNLAEIATHVQNALGERVTVREVLEQLEGYVKLSFLEKHPEDPELYRSAVRNPRWHGDSDDTAFNEKLVETLLSAAFFNGHRLLAGTPGSLGRVTAFSIPGTKMERFTQVRIEAMREALARIEASEEELQEEDPAAPRVSSLEVYLGAFGDPGALVEEIERYTRDRKHKGRTSDEKA